MTQNQIAYQKMLLDKEYAEKQLAETARHNAETEWVAKRQQAWAELIDKYNAESQAEARKYQNVTSATQAFKNMVGVGLAFSSLA